MKKVTKKWPFLLILIVFVSCFYGRFDIQHGFVPNVAYADSQSEEDLQESFEIEIEDQLQNIDFEGVEKVLDNLSSKAKDLFASNSFLEKLKFIISGEYADESKTFFSAVVSIFWQSFKDVLPLVASIISVTIIGGMINHLRPLTNGKSIGNIVHFSTYGLVIVFLGASLVQLMKSISVTLGIVKEMFDAIFPILLTLLTAVGGTVSVGIYQPAIALLSNIFVSATTYFLLPLFMFSMVFSIVGNLSNSVNLDKFVSFLQGTFKWTIGLGFTLFLGFVSIQGVMAGAVDGLSIRTAKYAIKSYVPIVGGYVADGFSIIMASSMLIKNAVGGVGLFLLLSTVVSPILNIVVFMLALKFMSGIIDAVGEKKIATFVSDLSKSLSLLVALLVGVAFMYMVLTGLIMLSANLVI